jgi:hypothetical protein
MKTFTTLSVKIRREAHDLVFNCIFTSVLKNDWLVYPLSHSLSEIIMKSKITTIDEFQGNVPNKGGLR